MKGGEGRAKGRSVSMLAQEPLIRVNKNHKCPICGKEDWCGFNSRIAICMRVPSDISAKKGWVHKLTDGMEVRYELPQPEAPIALVVVRDAVYRDLLNLLKLNKFHKDDLLKRGLSEEEIKENRFKSVPEKPWSVATELIKMGHSLDGIPGFYKAQGKYGDYWTFISSPGYFIPVKNEKGKIEALQIRVDNPGAGGKYRMFGSSKRPEGCCSGTPANISNPDELVDEAIWITEGPMKSIIASKLIKARVLGAVSVSTWNDVVPYLQDKKDKLVVLAFDMDQFDNFEVNRCVLEIKSYLKQNGFRVKEAIWEGAKGIDDALVAGVEIELKEVQ